MEWSEALEDSGRGVSYRAVAKVHGRVFIWEEGETFLKWPFRLLLAYFDKGEFRIVTFGRFGLRRALHTKSI